VQELAADASQLKRSGIYHFDLANDISNKYEAICGGQVAILLDAAPEKSIRVFEQMKSYLENRKSGVLISEVSGSTGLETVVTRYWIGDASECLFIGATGDHIRDEVTKLLADQNPAGFAEVSDPEAGEEAIHTFYLQPFFPSEKLIIAGAGHIGKALAHLGNRLDFEVTVIDDRPEYANPENIPDADYIVVKGIGEALAELATGDNTYVVIVTRGHKDDAEALRPCIGRQLTYTGMIGSRSKLASMRKDFLDRGWATAEQWDKIHAPVGLPIKSQTVEEIAVSIAAELVLVRNSRKV
jgi:xanthine dehydrogenase accessory factor